MINPTLVLLSHYVCTVMQEIRMQSRIVKYAKFNIKIKWNIIFLTIFSQLQLQYEL